MEDQEVLHEVHHFQEEVGAEECLEEVLPCDKQQVDLCQDQPLLLTIIKINQAPVLDQWA